MSSDKKHSESPLLVGDIARFLLKLSHLHKNAKTGNAHLAGALRQLSTGLQRHSNRPVSDLVRIMEGSVAKSPRARAAAHLPYNVRKLTTDEVSQILKDDEYTKPELIELGVRRFGISRSKLARLSKAGAHESISAALAHEKSLAIISQKAQRGGKDRS